MAYGIQDARLRELAFLTQLEREPSITVPSESIHVDPVLKSMPTHRRAPGRAG